MDTISSSEAKRRTVALCVRWTHTSTPGEKVRSGVHWIQGSSLLQSQQFPVPSVASLNGSDNVQKTAAEIRASKRASPSTTTALASVDSSEQVEIVDVNKIRVGLAHSSNVTVKKTGKRSNRATVQVTMTLCSLDSEKVYACVSALKFPGNQIIGNNDTNTNTGANSGLMKAPSAQWIGQTRFVDIALLPGKKTELKFKAVVKHAGTYNLNCFNITIGSKKGMSVSPICTPSTIADASIDDVAVVKKVQVQQSLLVVEE